jgi:hypothetical protein
MNHQIVIQYKNISFLIVSVYEPLYLKGELQPKLYLRDL